MSCEHNQHQIPNSNSIFFKFKKYEAKIGWYLFSVELWGNVLSFWHSAIPSRSFCGCPPSAPGSLTLPSFFHSLTKTKTKTFLISVIIAPHIHFRIFIIAFIFSLPPFLTLIASMLQGTHQLSLSFFPHVHFQIFIITFSVFNRIAFMLQDTQQFSLSVVSISVIDAPIFTFSTSSPPCCREHTNFYFLFTPMFTF